MISAVLAALVVAPLPSVSMIAPVSETGAWRIYTGGYWQTWQGRPMNQPRSEVVTGGKQPLQATLEGGYQVKRVQPIVNPAPIIGGEYSWGRFEAVDGLIMIGVTFRFTRDQNQGCGVNFRFCRNIRLDRCTFILDSDRPASNGGSGYGAAFSGCENVTLVNNRFIRNHAGAMFTDGTKNFAVFDSVLEDTWMLSTHGGSVEKGIFVRVSSVGQFGRLHIGNVTLPDGADGISIIDCNMSALEFSGKVRNAKVQGGSFREIILNQYKARPGDSQTDYSQENIEIDGSVKAGRVIVKSL